MPGVLSFTSVSASQEELQEAADDLHLYLSDQKPPLIVVDSISLLLEEAMPHLAGQIWSWVNNQNLTAPVCDYLFHAAKRIALFGDLDLIPRGVLAGYLRSLAEGLVPLAPETERETLRQNLERLIQAAPLAAAKAPMTVLQRPAGGEAAPSDAPLTRVVRRLSLLLEHLRPVSSAAPSTPPEQRTELTSQFVTAAATQANNAKELEAHLAPLRQLGIDVSTEHIMRTLAASLAGWALPVAEGQEPVASRQQLQAMRQIVSLADDPTKVTTRFLELVRAATEQFNEGHLGRATTMFELAERLVAEKKVKPESIERLRKQGDEQLDAERLRKYTERTDLRPQFRVILNFFEKLRPPALLQALNGEPKRERRHVLLALLEAHEQAARAEAFRLLKASLEPGAQADPYFQMNLVYLLRIIPRPASTSVDDEVNAVMGTAGRTSPPPLVKQIIAYLAFTRHEKAERALITYLKVFENMLLQPEMAAYPPAELEVLADRTCGALARYGTPRAWRLLIDHGLKSEARLGSPFLRLGEAGRCDFSSARDLVDRIIAALRTELPKKGLMGLGGRKDEDKALSLIGALAGTPLPEVMAVLQEIATTFGDGKLGAAATRSLQALATVGKPPPPPALSGDLDLFGLPNLLQTLNQPNFTGILSLMNRDGGTQATLIVAKGELVGGQCGQLTGEQVIYQLLEKPFPGTFAFVSRDLAGERVGPPQPFFPLLMEGVRRHDEFRRAAAVVPDGARLKPTGKPRTIVPDEDPTFGTPLWAEVEAGRTPLECEARIAADSYRVRRLLAHWVEEGALAA
jgi:uncharacterized protein DUF4388